MQLFSKQLHSLTTITCLPYNFTSAQPLFCFARVTPHSGACSQPRPSARFARITPLGSLFGGYSLRSQKAIFHILEFSPFYFAGSVNIQASAATLIPTASRVPFVLHLPAQCQHNCVNTWGSYQCTCRQGYKLQADGKTCLGKSRMVKTQLIFVVCFTRPRTKCE